MINVIYDNIHAEDYDRLIKEFEIQKVEYRFWDAIMVEYKAVEGINASHKMIVRWAKENGLDEVIIAEQDLMFTSPNSWKYFMEQKPREFDIYLSCTYGSLEHKMVCGFHLYIIHSGFYERFLNVPDKIHIDTAMDGLKGNYHFCYPFIALQRVGYSANNMAVVDYNKIFKEEDIYK